MKQFEEQLEVLKTQQKQHAVIFEPLILRHRTQGDAEKLKDILLTPGIMVSDFITEQLHELIKCRQPYRKFSTDELIEKTNLHIGATTLSDYGVWVYYPWSKKLVHLLDKDEFIEVRTSRNQYKISRAERDLLEQKKIGVIGLSVGQSVSVTLAMERGCGELRLADFDVLELTNLNRIRTGLFNLGLPKVYSVAREISEIDPFIKVICFPEGITEDNMDVFFTGNGKLDLLIEESDGFDIKILSRYKARELRIPVVMEGSDRCAVDVERFDLEPERSILHGTVDHLDLKILKTLKTTEQKIPYLLAILGLHTASARLRASMLEIDQSINTWPQLASSVTMGGGITADISRRILLDQYTESGKYHVDIEELIGNKNLPPVQKKTVEFLPLPTMRELAAAINVQPDAGRGRLNQTQLTQLVEAGCLAPSGGNSQPWRWICKDDVLYVFNVFTQDVSLLGYGGLSSYLAIGAAIENVQLRAKQLGLDSRIKIMDKTGEHDLVASLTFYKDANTSADPLAAAIGLRNTNRMLGERKKISESTLKQLKEVTDESVSVHFFTGEEELDEAADLLGELEKIRLLDERGHLDFVNEIRWTEKENVEKRDGVDIKTIDLNNTEKVGLEISRDPEVIGLIRKWNGGNAFKKLTRNSINAAGAVGILSIKKTDRHAYIHGGRMVERLWLKANLLGLAFQPVSASVFMYARCMEGKGEGLDKSSYSRFMALRPAFEKFFLKNSGERELFIFRLSVSEKIAVKSLRKPLNEMFYYL